MRTPSNPLIQRTQKAAPLINSLAVKMCTRENKTEEIYALIGRAHRACQRFEYALAEALYEWRIHSCPHRPLGPIEAVEEINKIQKCTFENTVLGRTITTLQKDNILEEDIIKLLTKFKNQRNDFIHDFHYGHGIELMLIEGNFERGTFNEEHVMAAFCKLKTDLNEFIHNMENAVSLSKSIVNAILKLR